MLEKSRVTSQQAGERNFHALHVLLDGAPSHVATSLFLDQPPRPAARCGFRASQGDDQGGGKGGRGREEDDGDVRSWRLLTAGQTSSDDALDASKHAALAHAAPAAYAGIGSALRGLGVTPPLLKGLWAALAALLHLGQVTYVEKEGSGGGGNLGCDAEGGAEDGDSGDDAGGSGGSGHLAQAAALLGVDSLSLHKALSEHVLGTMGRRTSIQVVQLGKAKAAGNRDALIRLLYAKVFGWVVRVANRAIAGHALEPATGEAALSSGAKRAAQKAAEALQKAQRSLSVLDIYGFEILDVGLRATPSSFHSKNAGTALISKRHTLSCCTPAVPGGVAP
jgi:hypothetical protein